MTFIYQIHNQVLTKMRYIKKFEEYDDLNIGDYVYLDGTDNVHHSESFNNFLKTHIGVIRNIDRTYSKPKYIYVNFIFNDDDSEEIINGFSHITPFNIKYILLHDSNLENLKTKIKALKYNI